MILKVIVCLLPWPLKRFCLRRFFGFEIDSTARIGLAWIFPKRLRMGKNSQIGHFTVAIHLDELQLGNEATIGRSNWITGYPSDGKEYFTHQTNRQPRLVLAEHSAVTKHHYLDCTHEIRIGKFSTVAGHHTEILTHSLDIVANRQDSKPVEIGDYCFVSTRCVILGGTRLPSYCVLAAGAVLNKNFTEEFSLYGGVPAKKIKELPHDAGYFHRQSGFVK